MIYTHVLNRGPAAVREPGGPDVRAVRHTTKRRRAGYADGASQRSVAALEAGRGGNG
jgi:hypothetical protein